jgi:hypothetical protein
MKVYACNFATGTWTFAAVFKQQSFRYEGDITTIQINNDSIQATGNQPFYVLRGVRLASRPLPKDVSKEEQRATEYGRWVEARDLKEGDVLLDKSGEGLVITDLSSRHEKARVYCLDVDRFHNCAVHRLGVCAHNSGKKGGTSGSSSRSLVKVYGTATLEHYEVSVVGAGDVSALMDWLRNNGYQVNPEAEDVLDSYIHENWAFVAVKLNPRESRHYVNEFLPPLTIQYQNDQLIFPLRISSVSTTQPVKITLYVLAESTVHSSNFRTRTLKYKTHLPRGAPGSYVESCIEKTLGKTDRSLVIMWSGLFSADMPVSVLMETPFSENTIEDVINKLMKIPFSEDKEYYLTRLQTRIYPAALTEDVKFKLDRRQNDFGVYVDNKSVSDILKEIKSGLIIVLVFIVIIGLPVSAILGVGIFVTRLGRWLHKRTDRQDRQK